MGSKQTTNRLYRIDVRVLSRENELQPGSTGQLWLPPGGESTGSVLYKVFDDYVRFKSHTVNSTGKWELHNCHVRLTRTDCYYGHYRMWFCCPSCQKRVAILYLATTLACRNCHQLNYASQHESIEMQKDRHRMRKVRQKLGWPLFGDVQPWQRDKPKGMHWQTYYRLCETHDFYELSYLDAFGGQISKLHSQIAGIRIPKI